jgi:2-keto-3-deoxy-L-rhamnonate aldolase RhmA
MMTFHQIMRQGTPLVATFVKTPHHVIVEVLGGTGLDAILLDAEHSTFGFHEIDRAILAARATHKPVLVRLPDERPSGILNILDMGADGIIIPHISTAEQAQAVVTSALYGDGGRGFATTTRAGAYGRNGMAAHLDASSQPTIIVQIEDPLAVENIESICAVPGISGVFIGPADLAVAYGVNDTAAPRVIEAVDHVIAIARKSGVPVASFASNHTAAKSLIDRGMKLVVLASEHSAMQTYFSDDALAKLASRAV